MFTFSASILSRSAPRARGPAPLPAVLVAVCRTCDGIALIPHQSTPRLRAGIERPKEVVNVRLPGHLVDVLTLLAERGEPRARSGTAAVLRVLLREFGHDPAFARRVAEHVDDSLARGRADHDLSVRVPSHIMTAVDDMAKAVGIPTRSGAFRAILATAKEDVLEGRAPGLAQAVARGLAAVA